MHPFCCQNAQLFSIFINNSCRYSCLKCIIYNIYNICLFLQLLGSGTIHRGTIHRGTIHRRTLHRGTIHRQVNYIVGQYIVKQYIVGLIEGLELKVFYRACRPHALRESIATAQKELKEL